MTFTLWHDPAHAEIVSGDMRDAPYSVPDHHPHPPRTARQVCQ
ncbi:MAG TPA: hypothetical protein VNE59_11150 [Burkholderiales bacterium]|nr:hypothetical protein [Burkholderiales bacterium]